MKTTFKIHYNTVWGESPTQQVAVFAVMIRHIKPAAAVKIRSGGAQGFLKGEHTCMCCIGSGNVAHIRRGDGSESGE